MQSEPQDALFHAFREAPARRARRWLLLAIAVCALVEGAVLFSARGNIQIVTPKGIRGLRRGMSAGEVQGVLGRPLAASQDLPGMDCLQYGQPHWRTAFTVYSLFFQDGKLREVLAKRFGVWRITRDGTLLPFQEPPVKAAPRPLL